MSDTPWDDIPTDVIEAAGKVAAYCKDRGYREFTICGLASESKVARLSDRVRELEGENERLRKELERYTRSGSMAPDAGL